MRKMLSLFLLKLLLYSDSIQSEWDDIYKLYSLMLYTTIIFVYAYMSTQYMFITQITIY